MPERQGHELRVELLPALRRRGHAVALLSELPEEGARRAEEGPAWCVRTRGAPAVLEEVSRFRPDVVLVNALLDPELEGALVSAHPAVLFAPVLKGWATLYPRFALAPAVDGVQLLTLALLAVVPYTVATLVPSWRAAIADPAAAMRGQP